jgi:hypothetical protein
MNPCRCCLDPRCHAADIPCVHPLIEQIHGARTERVLRRAPVHGFRQLRMPLAHLRRRRPFRPERLLVDRGAAEPLEAVLANSDAISDGRLVLHDQIEKVVPRIDDHRADRLAAEIFDDLAMPLLVDLGEIGPAECHAVVDGRAGKIGRCHGESRMLDRSGAKQRQSTLQNLSASPHHRQHSPERQSARRSKADFSSSTT